MASPQPQKADDRLRYDQRKRGEGRRYDDQAVQAEAPIISP
jgi:hypothetical protein